MKRSLQTRRAQFFVNRFPEAKMIVELSLAGEAPAWFILELNFAVVSGA